MHRNPVPQQDTSRGIAKTCQRHIRNNGKFINDLDFDKTVFIHKSYFNRQASWT